ncbi:hypothetical protein BDY21DRAFT_405089 [Lineolata rhizophorae]|uniref:DUF3638 domain-containing protein n=1 Tax=Lineolata rhizophorae TaxID=578093 RepID=A0A6A6NLX5_9PEZI|nr:hypothetical protein BDY21DRAFT_405089 [Lineolata rhizophorae]
MTLFRRGVRLDLQRARALQDLDEECMSCGGILLLRLEHLQSFELSGLDSLASR